MDSKRKLRIACRDGDLSLVKQLVESGVDYEWLDPLGRSPVMVAVMMKNFDVVKYLVNKDCKIDFHLIHEALTSYYYEIAKYLLENSTLPMEDYVSLFEVTCMFGQLNMVKYLYTFDIDFPNNGQYAFKFAIEKGHVEVVKFLISKGFNTVWWTIFLKYGRRVSKELRAYFHGLAVKEMKWYTMMILLNNKTVHKDLIKPVLDKSVKFRECFTYNSIP